MINIGIIGTGLIAREHARAIAELPNSVRLVAANDTVSENLQAFCSAFPGTRSMASATQLIADPDVHLVAITTPPAAHEQFAVGALELDARWFCKRPGRPIRAAASG